MEIDRDRQEMSASAQAREQGAQLAADARVEAFRRAIERRDHAALLRTLAPDVVFNSPIVHKPYVGRDAVAPLLAAVMEVFEDFRYVAEYAAPDGHALLFRTRVGDRELEGVDILALDGAGLVREFTVMVRRTRPPRRCATRWPRSWRRVATRHERTAGKTLMAG